LICERKRRMLSARRGVRKTPSFFLVFSLVEEFGRHNLQIADFISDWVELQNCIRGGL
jgi:hypothetical protein